MDAWNNLFNRTPPGQGNAPSTNPMGDNDGGNNPFGGGGIGSMWSPQADQSISINSMTQNQMDALMAQRDAIGNNYLWELDPRIDPFAWTIGLGGMGAGQTAAGKHLTPTGRGPNGEYGGVTGQGPGIAFNSVENIDPRLFGQISQWMNETDGNWTTLHQNDEFRNNMAGHFDNDWLWEQYMRDPTVSLEDKARAMNLWEGAAPLDQAYLDRWIDWRFGGGTLAEDGPGGTPASAQVLADGNIGDTGLDQILNNGGGGVKRKQIRKQHPNASGKKIARLKKAKANAPGTTPDALATDAGRALTGQPSRVPDGLGNNGGGSGLGNPPPGAGSALTGPPRAPESLGGTKPNPYDVAYDPSNAGQGGFGGGQGGKKKPGLGPNNKQNIKQGKSKK